MSGRNHGRGGVRIQHAPSCICMSSTSYCKYHTTHRLDARSISGSLDDCDSLVRHNRPVTVVWFILRRRIGGAQLRPRWLRPQTQPHLAQHGPKSQAGTSRRRLAEHSRIDAARCHPLGGGHRAVLRAGRRPKQPALSAIDESVDSSLMIVGRCSAASIPNGKLHGVLVRPIIPDGGTNIGWQMQLNGRAELRRHKRLEEVSALRCSRNHLFHGPQGCESFRTFVRPSLSSNLCVTSGGAAASTTIRKEGCAARSATLPNGAEGVSDLCSELGDGRL
eukprot:scaffold19472_cov37-Tisochrysis_lutea.AAC.1